MSVPGIVQSTLDGEEIAARVSLGGEDELFVTPSKTLVYSSEGLLSDESTTEYSHDADRLTLAEGRRKTKFSLEYPLEGTKEFTIPTGKTGAVLHPVLAGVLNGNGITDAGETVVQTYRFSELTLIITSNRLVKHIGGAVWDDDYEEYHFSDVTNLSFEDGSVATQIVLTVGGRPQRIKAPNEKANDLRERLQRALFAYHDVGSLEELNERLGDDEAEQDRQSSSVDFGESVEPLGANPPEPDEHETAKSTAARAHELDQSNDRSPSEAADASAGTDQGEHAQQTQQVRESTQQGQQPSTEPDSPAANAAETESQQQDPPRHRQRPDADEAESTADVSSDSPPVDERARAVDSDTTNTDSAATEQRAASLEESTSLLGSADTDDTNSSSETTATGTDTGTETGTGTGTDDPTTAELLERVESLEDAVARQNTLLERQQQTIEQLISELRASR
ncbi:DUF7115 domain-containing protein [Natronorubrum daqingense]|uniref:DUF7115 domain-containing protein n=1 Tax=Natronorubrum daqingense TaxID=588898 RepID=A0A1N7DY81_9EURY|nr:hypothetical protein [Natronorubrum daqingense]APX96246.1 hypothetical protein BB347_06200 [Natronorubrum daqingense]SIR80803.1 hypothetical protein SAMN05421809_2325 [Natronorubrum daqingense]